MKLSADASLVTEAPLDNIERIAVRLLFSQTFSQHRQYSAEAIHEEAFQLHAAGARLENMSTATPLLSSLDVDLAATLRAHTVHLREGLLHLKAHSQLFARTYDPAEDENGELLSSLRLYTMQVARRTVMHPFLTPLQKGGEEAAYLDLLALSALHLPIARIRNAKVHAALKEGCPATTVLYALIAAEDALLYEAFTNDVKEIPAEVFRSLVPDMSSRQLAS